MGHYKSNLRDVEFNLFEVFGTDRVLGQGPFGQLDVDSARDVLKEVERLSTTDLAASFADADRNPPVFDQQAGTVRLPASFLKSYSAYADGGWDRIDLPESLGGIGAPRPCAGPSPRWSRRQPAIYMFGSGAGFAAILHRNGTPEQQRFAELAIERPVGRHDGAHRARRRLRRRRGRATAHLQEDGTWHVRGVKRFITSAEWDWPENIFHLVLARPWASRARRSRHQGAVAVPRLQAPRRPRDRRARRPQRRRRHRRREEDGPQGLHDLRGHLRRAEPAVGTLVGDVHNGIAQMFEVIENARMFVGAKAISTLSTGYLNALEYAKQRVQGADMTRMTDKTRPA
jgi:alkylation response protein AidB-like acyl-CoA dehydrogenase